MWKDGPMFMMFSTAHLVVIGVLPILLLFLYLYREKLKMTSVYERIFASSLLGMEVLYQGWLIATGRWDISYSLPLELCSLSLFLTVVLLFTGNHHLYDIVFYAGIGGALQAIMTPDLELSFPHFRYFHFFYTHMGIILTACYFTWIKGFLPTWRGIAKTMIVLNVMLPIILAVNNLVDGNYMFLLRKPAGGSLLDYLGPYPWYLLSLEFVALVMFSLLWGVFRRLNKTKYM